MPIVWRALFVFYPKALGVRTKLWDVHTKPLDADTKPLNEDCIREARKLLW